MSDNKLSQRIKEVGLRVTPQRMIVLSVLDQSNHPSADQISTQIRKNHPNISTGTIYKILDAFVAKGIIRKVATKGDVMRYDPVVAKHHHLIDAQTSRIEDYYDDELFGLIEGHLAKKGLSEFELSEIKLNLIGKFKK